ncbi:hypothetical protein OQA88_6616 [Cercophora sp. LCS_1]
MAKAKNGGGSVQNRAIYSRASFLHQAAAFLSSAQQKQAPLSTQPTEMSRETPTTAETPAIATASLQTVSEGFPLQGVARRLATDLRSVSLKTRIRLTPAMKQTICKSCDSILIEGQTCTSSVENKSRGGRKPWADVLVRKCHTCERERRYPISAPRPPRKTSREGDTKADSSHNVQVQHKEEKTKQGG